MLVYEEVQFLDEMEDEEIEKEELKAEKRKTFEANLRQAGVEIEYEDAIAIKVKFQMIAVCYLTGCLDFLIFFRLAPSSSSIFYLHVLVLQLHEEFFKIETENNNNN